VAIEVPFYRVLQTYQIYVSRSLYNLTESIDNIMFYETTFAIFRTKSARLRVYSPVRKRYLMCLYLGSE